MTSTDSAGNPFDVFVIWDASAATLDITMLEPANLRAASNGSTCTIFGVPADFTGTYTIGTIPWISTASTHTERVSIPVSGGNVEADLTYNASTGRFTMNVDERAGVLWWMNNSCSIVNDPFVFTREAALVCE